MVHSCIKTLYRRGKSILGFLADAIHTAHTKQSILSIIEKTSLYPVIAYGPIFKITKTTQLNFQSLTIFDSYLFYLQVKNQQKTFI